MNFPFFQSDIMTVSQVQQVGLLMVSGSQEPSLVGTVQVLGWLITSVSLTVKAGLGDCVCVCACTRACV